MATNDRHAESSLGAEPYFGPDQHTPGRCRSGHKALCPTCGGKWAEPGSPFVCMGCHAVSPGRQRTLNFELREAQLAVIRARKKKIKFVPKGAKAKLKAREARELVAQYGDVAKVWLAAQEPNAHAS